jgi:hypothetical protein
VKSVAIVIVDTHEHRGMARLAIERTLRCNIGIKSVYSIAHKPTIQGEKFFPIKPISSLKEYSDIIINMLPYIVEEDHFFVVQWDGFVTRPELWSDDFFAYDYIGAPWNATNLPEGVDPETYAVGNGGFSFRSQKLLEAARKIPVLLNAHPDQSHAEDVVLCRHYRNELQALGIVFAPRDIGYRFSTEEGTTGNHLGFHGVPNLPVYLNDQVLIEHAFEIISRIHHEVSLIYLFVSFLRTRRLHAYQEFFNLLVANPSRLANLRVILARADVQIPLFDPDIALA